MHVLYDHQIYDFQSVGGISRYFTELISNLRRYNLAACELSVRYSNNIFIKELPEGADVQGKPNYYKNAFGGMDFRGKWRLYRLLNTFFPHPDLSEENKKHSISCLQKKGCDIFHPTYYDNYFLEYCSSVPFVITVYDMIHELFPEYFISSDTVSAQKSRLVRKATKIIAISQNTKNDLVRIYDIDPEKVKVIYLGSTFDTTQYDNDEAFRGTLPDRYILFVGDRFQYKNFYFFIESIVPLLVKDKSLQVVCTGPVFRTYEYDFFAHLGIKEQVRHFCVNDSQLACLYKNARVFVYPSLYEGFGMPVLESFSCGCPAVISRAGALPEVGGDAAAYVQPKDVLSIKEAVSRVVYNESVRAEMREKGYKQVRQFTWEKTARETGELYHSIIT